MPPIISPNSKSAANIAYPTIKPMAQPGSPPPLLPSPLPAPPAAVAAEPAPEPAAAAAVETTAHVQYTSTSTENSPR